MLSGARRYPLPDQDRAPASDLPPALRDRLGLSPGTLPAPECRATGPQEGLEAAHTALDLLPRSSPAESTVAVIPFKVSVASPDPGRGGPSGILPSLWSLLGAPPQRGPPTAGVRREEFGTRHRMGILTGPGDENRRGFKANLTSDQHWDSALLPL